MSAAWKLTLSEGLDRMAAGALTAADWVHSLLGRIEEREQEVRAWAFLDRSGALAAAGAVDSARAEGRPLGALAGAPLGLKDIIDVRSLPREAGSPLFAGYLPERDAPAAVRLRSAGAVILGKTVTTEFATNHPSRTRNPWNPARSPGGSSSGSAAAVEEGRLPLDLDEVHAAHRIIVRVEAAAYHEEMFLDHVDAYGPDIRNSAQSGLMVPAVHYLRALRVRARFTREMDRLFGRYDLVALPATMDTAPAAEQSTGSPLFNEPFSQTGHPALTLPLGRGEGNLPVGIQLGAPRLGEASLLAAARWCEEELGWRAEIAGAA